MAQRNSTWKHINCWRLLTFLCILVITAIYVCQQPIVSASRYFPTFASERLNCSIETPLACQLICERSLTVYLIPGRAGFGSEYVHTILAIAYAVMKQRRFRINSTYWNYGNFAHIFKEPSESAERYCRQPINVSELEQLNELIVSGDHNASHLVFSRFAIKDGIYVDRRNYSAGFNMLRKMFPGPFSNYTAIENIRHIVHALWQLTDKMNETVYRMLSNIAHSFDLHRPFMGLQIRRGDFTKSRQHYGQKGYEPISAYANAVLNASKIANEELSQVFVMTDDFRSILELSKYLIKYGNYTIAYLPTSEKRQGHNQSTWDSVASGRINGNESSRFETGIAELITELEMMRKADFVACSYYSNLCSVIQMIRQQPPETLIDVGNVGWSIPK